MKKNFLLVVVLMLGALAVEANEAYYFNAFTNLYRGTINTRLQDCRVCHTFADPVHAGSARNAYGSAFAANPNHGVSFNAQNMVDITATLQRNTLALQQIQNADSDVDGANNISEITSLSFPGNAADLPSGASVALSSPASGSIFSTATPVVLTASAFSAIGLQQVDFYDGGSYMGTDFSAPYEFTWNFTSANNGAHFWTARAIDTHGFTVFSQPVTLTVNIAPPNIATPPVSQIAFAKTNLELSVTSLGSLPLHYQWFYKNKLVKNATNSTLLLPKLAVSKSGDYFAVVTNYLGHATSAVAHVQVILPVLIRRQPAGKIVAIGKKYAFKVTATGTKPLHYQWSFDGSPIANATNASYAILPSVQATNAGAYSVVVGNVGSSVTSTGAILSVPALLTAAPLSPFSLPATLRVLPVANGLVEITLSGAEAVNCQIETSDDLIHWQPLPTVPDSGPDGTVFTALDGGSPNRLYRAVPAVPPPGHD